MTKALRATGSCLCGGVCYEVHGALSEVSACHCSQCARTTGHHLASTNCANDDLVLTTSQTLRWYRSSEKAERGFCSACGGNLFWRAFGAGETSIAAGTIDRPTGLMLTSHIYTASKSDYYIIADGAEQYEVS
ncbi:GFA family protein [Labrys okinawensis]|uniref:GFA family protein n=1 Tax=Labrys okinawensis TaxID=346911 RepID=UPI0039BCF87B